MHSKTECAYKLFCQIKSNKTSKFKPSLGRLTICTPLSTEPSVLTMITATLARVINENKNCHCFCLFMLVILSRVIYRVRTVPYVSFC